MALAKKRVNKLDIEAYSKKAKKYVANKNFSKQANAELKLYNLTMKVNRLELLKANIGLEMVAGFSDIEDLGSEILNKRAMDELERQAGILGESIPNATKKASELVNTSFRNATFSQRIWMHQSLLRAELDKLLQIGLIQGRNPIELARQLRKSFDASKRDAERLMRTELARVQTGAQKMSYNLNGYDYFEYIGGQAGQCPICAALDGKVFKVSEMEIGFNAPPMHPNCRCSTAANMEDTINGEYEPEKTSKALKNQAKCGIMKENEKGLFVLDENGNRLRCSIGEIPKSQIAKMKENNGWHADWKELATRNEIYGLYTDDGKLQSAMACRVNQERCSVYINWIVGNPNRKTQDVGQPLFAKAVMRSLDNGFGGVCTSDAANQKLVDYYTLKWGAESVSGVNGFGVGWQGQPCIDALRKYGVID